MKKFLSRIAQDYINSEEGNNALVTYLDLKNHPGWRVHEQFLFLLVEKIGNEMLSARFTELDPVQKDIRQRVYNSMYEVIRFLIDPVKPAQAKGKIRRHNQQMEATLNRSDQKGNDDGRV